MKSCLLVLFFIFNALCCMAQHPSASSLTHPQGDGLRELKKTHVFDGEYRPKQSFAGKCMLDKPRVIDSVVLEVNYIAEIIVDTLDAIPAKDLFILQIGKKLYKSCGGIGLRQNLNSTLLAQNRESEQIGYDTKIYTYVIDYTVIRNLSDGVVTNRHLLPKINNQVFQYEEPLPDFNWKITPDIDSIGGYSCHKAEGRYAGRDWTIWYTPEVPVDGGIWKFNGLPGLILKAEDGKKQYSFTLLSLEKVLKPMILYEVVTQKYTREKYREKERLIHEHPVEQTGDIMIVNKDASGNGNFYFMTKDWSLPYNPIELE